MTNRITKYLAVPISRDDSDKNAYIVGKNIPKLLLPSVRYNVSEPGMNQEEEEPIQFVIPLILPEEDEDDYGY